MPLPVLNWRWGNTSAWLEKCNRSYRPKISCCCPFLQASAWLGTRGPAPSKSAKRRRYFPPSTFRKSSPAAIRPAPAQRERHRHLFFYVPEVHIMYLTVTSWFLISFVVGGSGPRRAIKFLYAPASPPHTVWALKPPSRALVHKTTYAPLIYTVLFKFFVPKWHSHRLDANSQGPKTLYFQGPTS